jgi:hypothetical protein
MVERSVTATSRFPPRDSSPAMRDSCVMSGCPQLLDFDVRCLDNLRPLRGVVCDEFREGSSKFANGVPPNSASRALSLGSASASLISPFSLPMIAAGVLLGAPTPNHTLA